MEKTNKFISILSDYGFKVTFGDETDTLFLRKAIEALIDSKSPVKEIKFLRNEFIGKTEDARGGLYDLICEDENGNSFIVEMQLGYYKNYIHRSKFYAFQRYNTLVERGKFKFEDLKKVYCIGFLAHNIYPDSVLYYHHGTLKNQIGENLDDQITHIIVEIRKFDKQEKDVKTNLDKLIFVMKNLENIQESNQLPHFLSEDWIEQALKKLDRSKMTPEQRMHFEMSLAKQASIMEMLKEERRIEREEGRKEGRKEGREEGREEGRKEGREQGREQGREEANEEVAKTLKDNGVDFDLIAKSTGLSIEAIEKL